MAEAPYLKPFTLNGPIFLTPMPNGGWVVSKTISNRGVNYHGYEDDQLGAFSNTKDMLTALTNALTPNG